MNGNLKRVLAACCAFMLLGVAIASFLYSLLYIQPNNPDIDSFLYLGSRLLHGQLLFVHDFETKLPLVQYVFAIASYFGGIGAWRILVFALASVLGFFGSNIIAQSLDSPGRLKMFSPGLGGWCLFGLFMAFLYTMHGSGSAMLSMPATAAAYASLSLLLLAERQDRLRTTLLPAAGILLAMATLLRPNYSFVIAAYALYFMLREGRSRTLLFGSGYALASALCFVPYLTSSLRFHALLDGLIAIAEFPQSSVSRVFSGQGNHLSANWAYEAVIFSLGMLPFLIRRENGVGRKLIYLSLMGSAALELSFMATHYYWQYIMMFVAYVAPASYVSVRAVINDAPGSGRIRKAFSLMLVLLLVVNFASYSTRIMRNVIKRPRISFQINDRGIDHALLDFLRNMKSAGYSFLVIRKPYYHMLLDEPRIGDGNSTMINFVLWGYKLPQVSNIYLFSKQVQRRPCLALLNSDKDVFVVGKRSGMSKLLSKCFTNSRITLDTHVPHKLEKYDIYIRRSAVVD